MPSEYQQVLWGHEVEQVMDWMLKNERGWLDCMHTIGRYHPTDIITQRAGDKKAIATDPVGYGRDFLACHTDTTYYKPPVWLVSFLCTEYSTPEDDMINFFFDGFKVVQKFHKDNPDPSTSESEHGQVANCTSLAWC